MKIIKRTSDFFIRYLFGDSNNSDILLDFINSVMKDSSFETYESVAILNPFNLKQNEGEKESILDVKAVTGSGEYVIIEMQMVGNRTFIKRSLYYMAKTYSGLISSGEEYAKLKAVISINILGFNITEENKAHTSYFLIEKDSGRLLTKDFEMHFLELPKCIMSRSKDMVKDLALWIEFLVSDNLEEIMEGLIDGKPIMRKVMDRYNSFTADKDLMREYDRQMMYKLEYNLALDEERKQGIKQGIEEGIREGMEKGIKEGMEKGVREGKIETARNMRSLGIDIDTIIKATGLTREEIERL